MLMPALLFAFLIAAPTLRTGTVWLTTLGILFSWFGDVLLQSPEQLGFLLGLGAFLVAHVFYIWVYLRLGQGRPSKWTLLYLAWFAVLLTMFVPFLESLVAPVLIYGIVLGIAATLSSRVNRAVAFGAALFLISDTILAVDRFGPFELLRPPTDVAIMLTYLMGEGLIVAGIIMALRTRVEHSRAESRSASIDRLP